MSILPASNDPAEAIPPAHAPTRFTWRNLLNVSYIAFALAVALIALFAIQTRQLSDQRSHDRQQQVAAIRAEIAKDKAQQRVETCAFLYALQSGSAANFPLVDFSHRALLASRCPQAKLPLPLPPTPKK